MKTEVVRGTTNQRGQKLRTFLKVPNWCNIMLSDEGINDDDDDHQYCQEVLKLAK